MIMMRLLEGNDYLNNEGICTQMGDAHCYHQMWSEHKGGILVAENEEGVVVGWLSFVDKKTANQQLWPCRRDNADLHRLVSMNLHVDNNKKGLGIETQLAEEVKELSKEWGFNGVEVACVEDNREDSNFNGCTLEPFYNAGFQEVEKYHCDADSLANTFIIMEYIW